MKEALACPSLTVLLNRLAALEDGCWGEQAEGAQEVNQRAGRTGGCFVVRPSYSDGVPEKYVRGEQQGRRADARDRPNQWAGVMEIQKTGKRGHVVRLDANRPYNCRIYVYCDWDASKIMSAGPSRTH